MELSIQSTVNPVESTWCPKGWTADDEPEYLKFGTALDEFSQSTTSLPWLKAVCKPSPARPWNASQSDLFVSALKQAPKALMVAPYDTVQALIDLKELADQQAKGKKVFWDSFYHACRELGWKKK